MSLEGVTEAVMESLKNILKEKILELIPSLLREIAPDIVKCAKNSIEDFVMDNDLLQESVKQTLLSTDEEVENFKRAYSSLCNDKLKEREENLYKYTRCDRLIALFNECLQEEPMYIPKEFRMDRYHVKSTQELNIVTKMDLKRFQGECEILNCRREEFSKRVKHIDEEILDLVNENNVSAKSSKILIDRWYKLANEDKAKIDKKWDNKISSTKKAFEKDKQYFFKHQTDRVKNSERNNNTNNTTQIQVTFSTKEDKRSYATVVSTGVAKEKVVKSDNEKVFENKPGTSSKSDISEDGTTDEILEEVDLSAENITVSSSQKQSKNLLSHPSHEPPSPKSLLVPHPQTEKRRSLRNQKSSTCLEGN